MRQTGNHRSRPGQIAGQLKAVLTAAEIDDIENGGEIDIEAVLAAEATERAESTTISYFAFTATPKGKTLELFGRPRLTAATQRRSTCTR